MPPEIAVVILNWNGRELLERFLPSVVKHSRQAAVYVIDNASADDSRDFLKQHYPKIEIIALEANQGYAGGYNLGLQEVSEPFQILLNSDVEVSEGWLEPLLQRFKADPQLAALQPKILDLKEPGQFEYAGAAGGFIDAWAYPFCRGRLFDQLERDQAQYNEYRECFWATGACLVVRQEAFQAVKGFDVSLFAHMEEIDLCWRLHVKGFKVACEPASEVYHLGGATLQLSPQKTFLNFRNSLIVMYKNLPETEAFVKILGRLFLDGIAGLKFIAEGKIKHCLAILRAHGDFYRRLGDLQRNKRGMKLKALSSLPGVYPRLLIWQFFARGKKKFQDLKW